MDKEEEDRLIKAYEWKLRGETSDEEKDEDDDFENPKTPAGGKIVTPSKGGKSPSRSGRLSPNPAAKSPNFNTLV